MRFDANYMGTELDGRWWKPYRGGGFFVKGLGEGRIEGDALVFMRALGKTPFRIPLSRIETVVTGSWHRGQYGGKDRVVKVSWNDNGHRLVSGFAFKSKERAEDLGKTLRERSESARS